MPFTFDENGALLITGAGILADHQHSAAGDGGPLAVGVTDTDLTAGSVWFTGAGGLLQEDNANLFWDDGNDRLGIGIAVPLYPLHIQEAGATTISFDSLGAASQVQLRLEDTTRTWIVRKATNQNFIVRDNTAATNVFTLEAAAPANSIYVDSAGEVGFNESTPDRRVHAVDDSASTNVIIPIARLEAQVDAGAGAAGHGPSLELYGETTTTLNQSMAEMAARWSVATHASRRARIEFYAAYIGTDVLVGVLEAPATGSADGNSRGIGAVDLQGYRVAATEVASGDYSVLSGGRENTASNTYATVSGGDDNTASALGATIGGGQNNTASNNTATVGGGTTNTASGAVSTVAGGNTNTASASNSMVGGGNSNEASGSFSVIPGGYRAVADKYGQLANAAGRFSTDGDAQRSIYVARRNVATHVVNTWYSLWLDGASEQMTISASTSWFFYIGLIGLTQNAAQRWSYRIRGSIYRDNAGNTVLDASTVAAQFESDANYNAQVVADNVNEALEVQVRRTGGVDYDVNWVAFIETAEASYA